MNSVTEKEKKLTLALTKLKNLNYKNSNIKKTQKIQMNRKINYKLKNKNQRKNTKDYLMTMID